VVTVERWVWLEIARYLNRHQVRKAFILLPASSPAKSNTPWLSLLYRHSAPRFLCFTSALLFSFAACKETPSQPVKPTAPNAPSGLVGSSIPGSETSGNLTWLDNSDNETNFYIWRALNGEFQKFDSVGANVTQYTDNRIERGATTQYEVSAIDKTTGKESDKSNIATISPGVIPPSKSTPSPTAVSYREIDLKWPDSDKETSYDLFRGPTKAGVQKIITLPANATSYADTALDQSTDYFYALVARDLLAQTSSDTVKGTTKDAIINVNGTFHDIVTGQPISGKKVRLIYNTANDSLEVTTDGSGNYAFSNVKLVKGRQHDFAVRALGEQDFYNFLEKFSETYPNFTDVKLDPFSRPHYEDPEHPEAPLEERDMLAYFKKMHGATAYWDPNVMLVKSIGNKNPSWDVFYTGRMNDSSVARARAGLQLHEQKLNRKIGNEVSSEPAVGIVVQFGDAGPKSAMAGLVYDNNGRFLYCKKFYIMLPTNADGSPKFDIWGTAHELGHALWETLQESSTPNRIMGRDNNISDFEAITWNFGLALPKTFKDNGDINRWYILY